ncbi:hypothetical protein YC2023_012003 [Brassica napus]
MGQSPKQNQAHNLKDKGAQKPNRNKQTLGCQPKSINRCRRKPTGHHHVFDRPAIRRHGSGWESACFRRYQRGDATDPRRRRRQDEEEMLTRSSLQPDPNRSPDRREEEAIEDNRRETIESRISRKRQSNITGMIPVISRRQTPWELDAESKAGRLSPEEKG